MRRIRRHYPHPFVLDPSKLTRLLSVLSEHLAVGDSRASHKFVVSLAKYKQLESDDLEDVLRLDNSTRNRVERLRVTSSAGQAEATVEFSAEDPIGVEITAVSDDARTAAAALASAEEQVERTLQTIWVHRLGDPVSSMRVIPMLAALLMSLGFLASGLFDSLGRQAKSERPQDTLWLTPRDLADLRLQLQQTEPLSSQQLADITRRQLRNVSAAYEQQEREGANPTGALPQPLQMLRDWRLWPAILTVVILISLVAYVLSACYPKAVFHWGDAAEWHDRLIARRRTIWQVVVASLILGVLANLVVFGLSQYTRR